MSIDTLTNRVWNLVNTDPEGGTLTFPHLLPPTGGYIVAVKATQDAFGYEGCRRVVEYAHQNSLLVGWWNNENGIIQFDACLQIHNRREAEARGRKEAQRAIFDLNTFRTIYL